MGEILMKRLPVQTANELSNLINQMLIGKEALARIERTNQRTQEDLQYWYDYQHRAEQQLQAMGIHLAAPLE